MKEKDWNENKNLHANWMKLGLTRQNRKQGSLPNYALVLTPQACAQHSCPYPCHLPGKHLWLGKVPGCKSLDADWVFRASSLGFAVSLHFSKCLFLVFPLHHQEQMLVLRMLHILLDSPQGVRGQELGSDPRRQILQPGTGFQWGWDGQRDATRVWGALGISAQALVKNLTISPAK